MKTWWGFGIFAAGLSAGWLIRGVESSSAKTAGVVVASTKVDRVRQGGSAGFSQEQKIRAMIKSRDHGDMPELFHDLAPKDRMAALELMAEQAGPDGMNFQGRIVLDEFLRNWTAEDFDGAWAAAEACRNEGLRRYMMNGSLQSLAEKDPDRALALYLERIATDNDISSIVPLTILTKKLDGGAAGLVDLLSKLPSSPTGFISTEMQFPEGFDFQLLADGMTKLKAAKGDYQPPAFPSNFLERWAAKDAEAASAWWLQNGDLGSNGWAGILLGIEKSGDSGEASRWAAQQLQDAGTNRQKMIESISNASSEILVARLGPIGEQMPDAESRDRFYTDVMKFNQYGDPLDRYGFVMSKLSSAEARLQAIAEMSDTTYIDLGKLGDAQFQAWGFSREQARKVIKDREKK